MHAGWSAPIPAIPKLPPTMWDGTKHVKVDAEYFNGLARADILEFKKLVSVVRKHPDRSSKRFEVIDGTGAQEKHQ